MCMGFRNLCSTISHYHYSNCWPHLSWRERPDQQIFLIIIIMDKLDVRDFVQEHSLFPLRTIWILLVWNIEFWRSVTWQYHVLSYKILYNKLSHINMIWWFKPIHVVRLQLNLSNVLNVLDLFFISNHIHNFIFCIWLNISYNMFCYNNIIPSVSPTYLFLKRRS